jgi:NADH:ubiquinone oxidoreductase subunit K
MCLLPFNSNYNDMNFKCCIFFSSSDLQTVNVTLRILFRPKADALPLYLINTNHNSFQKSSTETLLMAIQLIFILINTNHNSFQKSSTEILLMVIQLIFILINTYHNSCYLSTQITMIWILNVAFFFLLQIYRQ